MDSFDAFAGADLIVGADGANSLFAARTKRLWDSVTHLSIACRYGTHKRFDALATASSNGLGHFNAHHHPHAPDMSTFVVEVDEATFFKNRFDAMPLEEAQSLCADVFRQTLGGEALISNHSIWRRFPKIRNARAFVGNCVLLGDALHTVHFSIGSGTRLAMEDALALAGRLPPTPPIFLPRSPPMS